MPSKSKTNRQDRGPLTRIREGVVISDSRDKTRTVSCQFRWQHPKYGKIIMRDSKFHVHDPSNEAVLGDRVRIAPCRPISKTKSWRLVEIVEKAPAGVGESIVGSEAPPEPEADAGAAAPSE